MISLNSIGLEFSARPLFKDVSFVINSADKMALVGKNGAGKSTMMKIIAGIQQPTSGSLSVPSDVVIGYLPQEMKVADDTSLINEVRKVFSGSIERKNELERVNNALETRTDYESDEYRDLIDRMNYLHERIAIEDSDNMEAEIERTLLGLGFTRQDFNRPTSEFSGGWRMRIELAKILLQNCDLLLLDEPTNHLDIESIQWLEQFLSQKAKAVLLVSHDRAFLDNVTNRTIEINCGKIYDYKVSYSQFVELRRERVEQQMRAYENQQKMIADTKEFIERFRYKPTKAVQVQSRIKQLEKIVPIEIDEVDKSHLNLKFPPAPRSGDYPLILENVGKAYGDHQVFDHAEFTIKRGEKVAFVGKNGEGKSTLVKCIMGEIPFTGSLKIGHNVKIGYFAQNQAQLLDSSLTVFDTIDRVAVGDIRTKIRDILGAFMFGGEDIDKKVSVLSGGEKTRLAMIKLLLEPVNLLILDEPTNDLDIMTLTVLEDYLREFNGCVIVISHDRYFLDSITDHLFVMEGEGRIKDFPGNYSEYREWRKACAKEAEKSNAESAAETPKKEKTPKKERKTFAERKEFEQLEKDIEELTEEKAALEQLFNSGGNSEDIMKASRRYEEVKELLDEKEMRWLELDEKG